jgi:hypothetical protein
MKLTPSERDQLAVSFGCARSDVNKTLKAYSEAATEEYVRMILGQKVFTRGTDVREYRLMLLIQHVFDGLLPGERIISALFQTTTTQSRALLRAVMSKYQYELSAAITKSLAAAIKGAELSDDKTVYALVSDSENIIDALNKEIAMVDGSLSQISKARGTVSTYEITPSSYAALKARLALDDQR